MTIVAESAGSRHRVIGAGALIAAALFWAGNYVLGHLAVAEMNPASMVLLRWALAVVPLFVLAQLVERPRWREVLQHWRWHAVLGLLGLGGYTLLLYGALVHTSTLNASLINAFNPALIVVAAIIFLREKITALGIVGILVALIGVFTVLTEGRWASIASGGLNRGDLLMIGAILCWTAYTIAGRYAPRLPAISSIAIQAAIVVIVMIPVTAIVGFEPPRTTGGVLSLLYIAIFPSILSYIFWNRGLRSFIPGQAGVFLNLITVFTVIIAVILGQVLTVPQVIGGVLVLVGIVLTNAKAFRPASRL